MVSYKDVKSANSLVKGKAPSVAVFVGATSGIGSLTLEALVATGDDLKIYLIGRKNAQEQMLARIDALQAINPKANIIWTEGEVSLLSEVKRICEFIASHEPGIDLLFLSAGYAPFGPRQETAEGLEVAQSLEVYSRILFILQLLPLLNKATAPRVVSVLGGGMETANIDLLDLDLKRPGNFSGVKAQGHYPTMQTALLEKVAVENPDVTFIHSWPGVVNTGNVKRSINGSVVMAWFVWLVLEPLVRLLTFSDEEAAQRHLFISTSAAFGGQGTQWLGKPGANTLGQSKNGLFLVNNKCDCTSNAKVMSRLREDAMDTIWHHTHETLRPYM